MKERISLLENHIEDVMMVLSVVLVDLFLTHYQEWKTSAALLRQKVSTSHVTIMQSARSDLRATLIMILQ